MEARQLTIPNRGLRKLSTPLMQNILSFLLNGKADIFLAILLASLKKEDKEAKQKKETRQFSIDTQLTELRLVSHEWDTLTTPWKNALDNYINTFFKDYLKKNPELLKEYQSDDNAYGGRFRISDFIRPVFVFMQDQPLTLQKQLLKDILLKCDEWRLESKEYNPEEQNKDKIVLSAEQDNLYKENAVLYEALKNLERIFRQIRHIIATDRVPHNLDRYWKLVASYKMHFKIELLVYLTQLESVAFARDAYEVSRKENLKLLKPSTGTTKTILKQVLESDVTRDQLNAHAKKFSQNCWLTCCVTPFTVAAILAGVLMPDNQGRKAALGVLVTFAIINLCCLACCRYLQRSDERSNVRLRAYRERFFGSADALVQREEHRAEEKPDATPLQSIKVEPLG